LVSGTPAAKQGKTAIALGDSFRSKKDPLEGYDSDDKEKKVNSGATQAFLRKNGMMQATPQPSTTLNDGWLDRLSPSKYLEGTPPLYLLLI
jgi:hypothetical protein